MRPPDDHVLKYPLIASEAKWLVLVLMAVFAIGCLIVPDYGQSTDEYSNFQYAADSLRAYAGSQAFLGPSFQELHGPFHLELAYLAGEAAVHLPFGWTRTDGHHLANFAAFLLGVASLYVLLRREFTLTVAGLTTALFATQPLLWGHGFINQKDTPFMAYFLLAMALGLTASDRLRWGRGDTSTSRDRGSDDGSDARIRGPLLDAGGASRSLQVLRWTVVGGTAVLAVASLGGLVFLPAARAVLTQAYSGTAWGPIQAAFGRLATDAYKTPIALYLDKVDLVYAWMKVPLAIGWLAAGGWLTRRWFPALWSRLTASLPIGTPLLIASGVALGMADSIRVAAPLAGLLVGGWLLAQHRRRGWIPLAIYGITAVVTTYLTWPWLWLSPIDSYVQAVQVMSAFPSHQVLFGGMVFSSSSIPWDYIPRLMALQTTEFVIPLAVVGMGLSLWTSRRGGDSLGYPVVCLLWLGAPIAIAVVLHSSLYGNLRQMLFVLPPLFILGAYAIRAVVTKLSRPAWRAVFGLVVLAPGVIGLLTLHPYEDSYFNAWVGGTSGAFGRYQVDPWCTSYREAVAYINAHAPSNSVVDVRGPFQSAADFARPDLVMRPDYNPSPDPDYELLCQIDLLGDGFQEPMPVVYQVNRGRAVLALVRAKP